MAVCKFWQEGRCRYGDSCRYEHPTPRGQDFSSNNRSNNRYAPLQAGGNFSGTTFGGRGAGHDREPNYPYNLKENIIRDDLREDRPIWEFSAYGPGSNAPRQLFGGYPIEQSPEELRVHYYLSVASRQEQRAKQEVDSLSNQLNQQIDTILRDTRGALRYIVDGEKEHPNRLDVCKEGNTRSQGNPNLNGPSQSTTSMFGQPSAFGTSAPQSGFGAPSYDQPSAPGQRPNPFLKSSPLTGPGSAFGRPSASGQGSTFGQPSGLGQGSAFGQPSVLGQTSTFGRLSQLGGQTSSFGQPSSLGHQSSFGRPPFSQPSFGQPSAFQSTASPFATAGKSGQQPSPFAQAINNDGGSTGTSFGGGFGQPSSSTARNPFKTNAQTSAQTTSAPETSMDDDNMQDGAFSQPSTNSRFGAPSSSLPLTNGIPKPQTNGIGSAAQPDFEDLRSYSTRDSSGKLLTWKGKSVVYQGTEPFYTRPDDRSLERIWFPDGAPQNRDQTEAPQDVYAGVRGELEQAYQYLRDNDAFKDGVMPPEPPMLEWRRYDL